MNIGELLFVIALAGGFLVPTALFGQWWLFSTFAIFFVCFGIVEFLAVKFTKKTVSQHFWDLKRKNPKGALIIVGGMLLGWIALIAHFMLHK